MKARAAWVGRRLCVGTCRQLEAWPRWQFAADYAAGEAGVGAVVRHMGVIVRRAAGVAGTLVFYGLLLQRVPGGIYAVPVVWAIGAWQMSDSSATPPPGSGVPSGHEAAVQELADGTTLVRRKGMSIFLRDDDANPARTHVRVQVHDQDA